jgi:drug/metabolite transporter (DMT)-like permease
MKPEFQIIIAALLLGTIGILTKLIGSDVHPTVIAFYRVFFAMIMLAILCPMVDKTTFKPKRKDLGMYALIGLIFAISMSLIIIAYSKAPIQNITLLSSMAPFFVLIFAYFILKEKITKTKILTLIIAIIGLIIISPIKAEGSIWNIIAIIVAAIDGVLIVLMRKEDQNHPIGDVFWFFLFATIFLLPFPLIFGLGKISIYVFLIGFVTTGIGYFFYNLGLEKIEAEIGSIIMTVIHPVINIILAFIIISEKLNPQVLIGGAILVAAGVYLETHNKTLKAKGIHKRKWLSKRFLRLKKR